MGPENDRRNPGNGNPCPISEDHDRRRLLGYPRTHKSSHRHPRSSPPPRANSMGHQSGLSLERTAMSLFGGHRSAGASFTPVGICRVGVGSIGTPDALAYPRRQPSSPRPRRTFFAIRELAGRRPPTIGGPIDRTDYSNRCLCTQAAGQARRRDEP